MSVGGWLSTFRDVLSVLSRVNEFKNWTACVLFHNVGNYQSMLQNIPVLLDCLSFESGLIGYPETSVID